MVKKAQVRMTETIAVLFIFFVLVLFGLIFYANIQKSSLEERTSELAVKHARDVALNALFLPELSCSKGENIPIKDCIDLYKLEFAHQKMQAEKDYYYDVLGFAKIYVNEIYPGENEFVLYDNALEGATRSIRTPIPVSLFDPVKKTFEYGVLTVETYS